MFIKYNLDLFLEVAGDEQADEAGQALEQLDAVIGRSFPYGDVLDTEVNEWRELDDEEVKERGFESE